MELELELESASILCSGKNSSDYAVVVGIKHYTDLKELKGPIKDAENFRDWLISADGGDLPPGNVIFIPSSDSVIPFSPLQFQIDEGLEEIETKGLITGCRRLYFYFSGHGIGASWSDTGMCLPKWSQKWRNYALSSSEYFNYFVSSDLFEEVLFFLDCCRNRVLNARPFHPNIGWAKAGGGKTLRSMSMLATDFENVAREALTAEGDTLYITGYFTSALIEGLKGAAVDAQGDITMSSLNDYVRVRTQELAQVNNHVQSARLGMGEVDKNFIIKHGLTQPKTTVEIKFPKAGNYRLEGAGLLVLQQGLVPVGHIWIHPNLEKNVYSLLNTDDGTTDYIRVDGTLKSLQHECKC